MESFKIENLSFTYPDREKKALDNVCLTVKRGEFITLCGKSGCGKTTLLRLLKTSLAPFGTICGNIYFYDEPLAEVEQRKQAAQIGFVMQNPENQIVTDKVWHELAFGLESLGYSTPEIRTRVAEMAAFFGIETWFHKKVTELSGGQKQILNLASVMLMQPSVLILDEPTSQLDPIAASEFLKTLEKINREIGTTIILSEHRLEDAFPISDRIIVMDKGRIIADGDAKEVCTVLTEQNHDMRLALPTPMRVYSAVKNDLECPVTVREGREWLEKYASENPLTPENIPEDKRNINVDAVIELKNVWFRYEKDLLDIVKGLNVKVNKGELFAILGGNGAGKTTALSLISGLNTPYRGEVYINGEKISKINNLYNGILGVLPQNPQSLFVKKTVYLDLMEMLSEKKLSKQEKEKKIRNISELCRITELLESHPYDLSGGEQQRAALAKILLNTPNILLLDEPTKGLDAHFKKEFADILYDLKSNGVTVVMVSHDVEFCAEYADLCSMFFDGNITATASPRAFFSHNSFYTTVASRMARNLLPKALLADDIILACRSSKTENTYTTKKYSVFEDKTENKTNKKIKFENIQQPENERKLSKRTLFATLFILVAVPLTIWFGTYYLDNRKYYFISLLIILETLIPFITVFESRKPQARELVVISVLCAIAVAGRTVFSVLPQFKPVIAILIISGVCFGGETGFLIGAVTGFVSNFFFGQGPWTTWQMFALGIVGFLAGILFRKGLLKKTKVSLCIFGFLATVIIYGGIMNPASVIMYQGNITREMIISSYLVGLPYDLIHAVSTAIFLWLISEPMIDKLERIKTKYGLINK